MLEKVRLEKKIAALESERRSFGRNRVSSEYRLTEIISTTNANNEKVARMSADLEAFNSRFQYGQSDNMLNPVKIDGAENTDVKDIAAKLAHIGEHTDTDGEYFVIGELYGFKLLVTTEKS